MIKPLIHGVLVLALLPLLAGCGRGTQILDAAERGDARTVARLLKKDPSLVHAARFGPGWSPLLLSSGKGHAKVVALLLQAGAPIEDKAVRDAAAGGHIEVVELFLAKGVDINGPGNLLEGAVSGGRLVMVQWLLAQGASVEGKPGSTRPLDAAASGGHKAIAELLLANGARADAKDKDGHTALASAARAGNTDIAELLIQRGAKVHDATTKGFTPLMHAADSHSVGTVRLLLERGADVNARDSYQNTALIYALRRRLTSTAEERAEIHQLGGQSAKVNGEEAWVVVLKRRRAAVVELLLARGADVNALNEDGETAATMAAKKDCLACEDVARLLAQPSRPR